jgi:NAD(P)-dependent dehydrogenase (short-subunit alcohol dehydrogenase family)
MGKLAGRVALVTGGAKGIGRAVAQRFASEGASVAIAGRDMAAARRTVEEIGGAACAISLDATSPDQWQGAIAEIDARFGKLNLLVNSAGLTEASTLEHASDENWRRHMDINLDGPFYGCRAALPLMQRSGEPGGIINISSLFALRPMPGFAAYCASKAALTMMSQVLALELAANGSPIRVNTVHPGGIETEMLERTLAESGMPREAALAHFVRIHPMGRMGKPEEVAAACLWLASDESSFTTGHALTVDGGSYIRP